MQKLLVVLLLLLVAACGGDSTGSGSQPAKSAEELVSEMEAAAADLLARPEHSAQELEVSHVLISFAGQGVRKATRIQSDARKLAAELYARAMAGEDFEILMSDYSDDDLGPGTYSIVVGTKRPGQYLRSEMYRSFGDVAWRLNVGEIGMVAFEKRSSPMGWHILKRIK